MTTIPQIGDITPHTSTFQTNTSTTRDHPLFILTILKPLIDLYQLGDATAPPVLDGAKKLLNDFSASHETTPKDIDKTAKLVINILQSYHKLA
jgi:hypothetical protein